MYRIAFGLYFGVSLVLFFNALSSWMFREVDWKRTALRLALVFVWPLAMLSSAGRRVLFSNITEGVEK